MCLNPKDQYKIDHTHFKGLADVGTERRLEIITLLNLRNLIYSSFFLLIQVILCYMYMYGRVSFRGGGGSICRRPPPPPPPLRTGRFVNDN